jgi:signal transduction histidine kinase/CheY-like chemotaxis protein
MARVAHDDSRQEHARGGSITMIRRRRPHPAFRRSERYTSTILHALLNLYQLLRSPRPLDSLLQAILDTAIGCVPGAQRGSLLVASDGGLAYRAVCGYDLEALRPVIFPTDGVQGFLGGGHVSQVESFRSWDAANLSPEAYAILFEHGGISQIRRSVVGKIYVGERFYGTLVLDNLLSHAPFPPQAETLTRLFAEQAGSLLEQALLLEQLRQTSTQLVEAEKLASLGRFIASIAHEINNPLTAVLGYADFLAERHLDDEAAVMLGQLRVGAERVRAIVRNLQLFARQQRGGPSQVHLNLLVEQSVMLKRGELMLDQIEVALRLDSDVPYTWADGGQLSQVLLNLLTNAQHTLRLRPLPRQIVVTTALLAGEDGPGLQLQVRDNGPGIEPAILPRIFEPFFTTKPAGEGTGLGLSICHGIVIAHGGTITVETTPGDGATFTVWLPVRTAPVAPPPVAVPAPAAGAPRPTGLRVLLVEDDPAVVNVVLRTLGDSNSVEVAADGADGLRRARAGAYDLVLCDLRMPAVGGLELHRRLSEQRPELAARLLFISGDTSSAATRRELQATGQPLLTKPFRPEELYAAIAAMRD